MKQITFQVKLINVSNPQRSSLLDAVQMYLPLKFYEAVTINTEDPGAGVSAQRRPRKKPNPRRHQTMDNNANCHIQRPHSITNPFAVPASIASSVPRPEPLPAAPHLAR